MLAWEEIVSKRETGYLREAVAIIFVIHCGIPRCTPQLYLFQEQARGGVETFNFLIHFWCFK
jgi:hypothetical protein